MAIVGHLSRQHVRYRHRYRHIAAVGDSDRVGERLPRGDLVLRSGFGRSVQIGGGDGAVRYCMGSQIPVDGRGHGQQLSFRRCIIGIGG